MKDVRTCPHCGIGNKYPQHAGGSKTRQPNPGDFAICAQCCGVSVYTEDGDPRFPTEQEALTASRDIPTMLTIAASVLSISVRKGEKKTEED
jgi:hypothetical protein